MPYAFSRTNIYLKRIEESARSADLTIRLVVKANSMSVRTVHLSLLGFAGQLSVLFIFSIYNLYQLQLIK